MPPDGAGSPLSGHCPWTRADRRRRGRPARYPRRHPWDHAFSTPWCQGTANTWSSQAFLRHRDAPCRSDDRDARSGAAPPGTPGRQMRWAGRPATGFSRPRRTRDAGRGVGGGLPPRIPRDRRPFLAGLLHHGNVQPVAGEEHGIIGNVDLAHGAARGDSPLPESRSNNPRRCGIRPSCTAPTPTPFPPPSQRRANRPRLRTPST